ncbi:uncharacterized protein LOC113345201 [Papaver somniferum]|uniref:uncharacterized protein LOC113345201 n=1 Tax=Papaver somniferum TaxID=3469 RepID=UPI000E6F597E|nr:uncharacterized protein LOC113345201 [Papaver somniferum]
MEVIEEIVLKTISPQAGLVQEKITQFSKENSSSISSQRKLVELNDTHTHLGGLEGDSGGGARSHFIQKPTGYVKSLKVVDLKKSGKSSRKVSLIQHSSQAIFLDVLLPHNKACVFTFVYGDNDGINRSSLWNDLVSFSCSNNKPWMILGDFNSILEYKDKLGKAEVTASQFSDFQKCTQYSQIFDLAYTGCFYTWSNFQEGEDRVMGKIDRVLVNLEGINQFQDSLAEFLNLGVSDHSPSVVTCFEGRAHGPPPFRFCNFLVDDDDFLKIVESVWNEPVKGNHMVVLVTKLKKTKKRLMEWRKAKFSKLSEQTSEAKKVMLSFQTSLQERPLCVETARKERQVVHSYVKLSRSDESLAQQNSKVEWMEAGDSNFENLLQQNDCDKLLVPVTRDEVVWALSSIHYSKSPGPDGFTSYFFKKAWSIVGDTFVAAFYNVLVV